MTSLPKILAMYLPQFHRTPHNDEWWGEGYTEWVAVKEAQPIFEGHKQPQVPLDSNYYDLLDKETMKWQADLAQKYGIDGFIFYHYYFGEGKMELEKPAQLLLDDAGINLPFCFCWANQSWVRSWSKMGGNPWNVIREEKNLRGTNDLLVEQVYGEEDEWKRHFEYLLPFFEDDRYIKVQGKPVFIVYAPNRIPRLGEMITLWRGLAEKEGLPGLHMVLYGLPDPSLNADEFTIVETTNNYVKNNIEKVKYCNGVTCIDYSDFCKYSESSDYSGEDVVNFQAFCGYDNTPRMGSKGICLIDRTPERFQSHITNMLIKSVRHHSAYLSINAWNEWGEGMHLEPDVDSKYDYLQAVSNGIEAAKNMITRGIQNDVPSNDGDNKTIQELHDTIDKYKYLYHMCSLWADKISENSPFIKALFEQADVKEIAIYGMGDLGRKLLKQCEKEKLVVRYAIDTAVFVAGGLDVFRPGDDYPSVDAIVITAYDRGEIKEMLQRKTSARILHLSELLQKDK